MMFWRGLIVFCGLVVIWQLLIIIFGLPNYILPSPLDVWSALHSQAALIASQSLTTITEAILGLIFATVFGCTFALCMAIFKPFRYWLLPLLLISQALPTFAIAPLLVIWLGYGITSKIVTTIIMLFFPIASAFYDGLKSTEPGYLDLAKVMNATKIRTFLHIRIPAALPNLATGLRVATAAAPIGAIIGEWVGSSSGLGFLMLNANARMQIDLMFAVLLVIIAFGLLLYFGVDYLLNKTISWHGN